MERDDAELLRSVRYVNFDEREIDEYVSSESDEDDSSEEEHKLIEERPKMFNMSESDINQSKIDMIFMPFKPGKDHNNLRQFPHSAQNIPDHLVPF